MDLNDIKTELVEIKKLTLLGAKNVLNVNDVALLLGKSRKTIYNMLDELPHYRNAHGIYFKKNEIEAWQCQVPHNAIKISVTRTPLNIIEEIKQLTK